MDKRRNWIIGTRKDGSPIYAIAGGAGIAVGGPNVPAVEANPDGAMVPFRRATTNRITQISTTTKAITAAEQNVEENIEGSGFIYGVHLDIQATVPSANSAAVAYVADAPWSALSSIVLKDVNGELVNTDGFSLWLANLYGGWTAPGVPLLTASGDTNIYQAVTGTGATGGNFRAHLFVPVALNRRTLLGLLGNQDRAQRYSLRTNLAPSASIYSTGPTAAANLVVRRFYDNYAVPASHNANGAPQQQMPDKFGVLHYLTQTVNPGGAPLGGSKVNHYLPRLGNTLRLMILVLRSNGSRATAESNMPDAISFRLGDMPIFNDTVGIRRKIMLDRYGWDAPAGVLVYDFITDLGNFAGSEFGDDWAFTAGLVNAQFEIQYPSGFGSTANTLTVITSDLQIPADVDPFA